MATITAAMVKELREMTGSGMMDCKKALTECDGNFDEAIEYLRKRGLAQAEKKASRIAAEGVCDVYITADNKTGAIVEVNSETDFVAKNEKFRAYVEQVAQQAAETNAADIDAFLAETWKFDTSKTVDEARAAQVAVIGENLKVRRFVKYTTNGFVVKYIHMNGKIAILLDVDAPYSDATVECAKNLAMQIAAMNPTYVNKDEISAETLAKEKEIVIDSSLADPASLPKPILNAVIQEALDKNLWNADDKAAYEAEKNNKFWYNFMSNEGMQVLRDIAAAHKAEYIENKIFAGLVEGRFAKRLKEICLVDQEYVKAEDKENVGQYIAKVAKDNGCTFNVNKFVRFETGEGLEKRNEDFAAEVAKQMGQ
ncbi:MAG: elongation factor Ts [Lachnospiraceae bacterium]|nr:elongation factor Ts [Lachnospiraceae bacterium]